MEFTNISIQIPNWFLHILTFAFLIQAIFLFTTAYIKYLELKIERTKNDYKTYFSDLSNFFVTIDNISNSIRLVLNGKRQYFFNYQDQGINELQINKIVNFLNDSFKRYSASESLKKNEN